MNQIFLKVLHVNIESSRECRYCFKRRPRTLSSDIVCFFCLLLYLSRAPSTVPTPQSSLKQSFKMEDPPSSKKSARNAKEKTTPGKKKEPA